MRVLNLTLLPAQHPVSVPKKRVEDKDSLEERAGEGSGVFSHQTETTRKQIASSSDA